MRSAQELRSQAREMEKDAREIEELEAAIAFLNDHKEKPSIEVHFPGFKQDGRKPADAIGSWVLDHWPKRREMLLEDFRARRDELKGRWDA